MVTRLQEIMEARGLQSADLARLSSTDPSTLSKLVNGKRELRRHWAARLAQPLNVRPDDLLASVGSPIPSLTFSAGSDVQPIQVRQPMEARRLSLGGQVPVMGTVSCGSDGQFEVNLTDDPIDYVDLPAKLVGVPGIYALIVAGESMLGAWSPGDPVYVSKHRPVTPGCYVVVLVEDGPGQPPGAFLKEFERSDNDTVVLRQYNPGMERVVPRAQIKQMHRALHWREWAL